MVDECRWNDETMHMKWRKWKGFREGFKDVGFRDMGFRDVVDKWG